MKKLNVMDKNVMFKMLELSDKVLEISNTDIPQGDKQGAIEAIIMQAMFFGASEVQKQ